MCVFMTYWSICIFKDCGRRMSRHVCGMQGIGIHGARVHEVTAASILFFILGSGDPSLCLRPGRSHVALRCRVALEQHLLVWSECLNGDLFYGGVWGSAILFSLFLLWYL